MSIPSGPYIKDGAIQSSALMTRDLAGKVIVTVDSLSLAKSNNASGPTNAGNDFPFDYYNGTVRFQYPDAHQDNTVLIPDAVIYNAPRASGKSMKWPGAFKRTGFVAYFEPKLKQGYDAAVFGDRKFQHTPDDIWTELQVYDSGQGDNKSKTSPLEIIISRIDKKTRQQKVIRFDSFEEMFSKSGNAVAIKGTLAGTMKLRSQVTKGSALKPNEPAYVVITPTQFKIHGPVDIAQPSVAGGKKSAITYEDNADDDFFAMIEKGEQHDDDESGTEAGEDEDEEAED